MLVRGDLNVKAREWSSPYTDKRGQILRDWIAVHNLVVLNDGEVPTFQRANSQSYIDVTFASRRVTKRIGKWSVLEGETLSGHKHIYVEIKTNEMGRRGTRERQVVNIDRETFKNVLTGRMARLREPPKDLTPEVLTKEIKVAQTTSTTRMRGNVRKVPYWWWYRRGE